MPIDKYTPGMERNYRFIEAGLQASLISRNEDILEKDQFLVPIIIPKQIIAVSVD